MDTLSYKTKFANDQSATREWVVIDATDAVLGRMSSQVASLLRGKHKPNYTPNTICGDQVIVLNADKVRMTGKKMTDRVVFRHSGYPGGQSALTPKVMKAKSSTRWVEHAIRGMLPKGPLGREMFRNLWVYEGSEHPHAAQQPKEIKL